MGSVTHLRACNLCEAICGLEIEADLGARRVLSIRGDNADPLSRGHICPKAVALQDLETDPNRLRTPQRRERPDHWSEVSWSDAFDEIATRTRAIQARYGRNSVGVYLGNPNVHNLGSLLYARPFLHALGTRNRYSATSVDQLPHHLAAILMFGHQFLLPIPDIDRTSFLLVLGANPLVSNGSLMTAPGMRARLKALRERGGTLVVVDPRRTETARVADRFLAIRPGTDALFLLALLAVVFEENLAAPGPLADLTDGLDTLARLAADFAPERVGSATGLEPAEIRQLARDFAAAPRAACYGRLGVSVQPHGTLCQWLINALNLVTGNLDREGGAMFANPAVDLLQSAGPGHVGRWHSRVRGLPEVSNELPVATLAEEIDTPGNGQIRALFTIAGNPVLSTPNGPRLERALPNLELMVSIDPYLNETTRFAHFILPTTPPLQRDHYDLVFHQLAVADTTRYSPALFPREAGLRHDWEVLDELTRRLDRGPLMARLRRRAVAALGPRRQLDVALRGGPRGAGWWPGRAGLTLARLEREPHGIDLGPRQPSLALRLRSRGRRVELAPQLCVAGATRLLDELTTPAQTATADELLLIGRRQVQSNNSWMHNVPRLMRGKERCTLLMHPDDAATRGLADGELVEINSRTGAVEVPLEVSDEIRAGVVSLPHGWGHDRPGIQLEVAASRPGASLNDLTDELRVDPISGNAALSGVSVRVTARLPGQPAG